MNIPVIAKENHKEKKNIWLCPFFSSYLFLSKRYDVIHPQFSLHEGMFLRSIEGEHYKNNVDSFSFFLLQRYIIGVMSTSCLLFCKEKKYKIFSFVLFSFLISFKKKIYIHISHTILFPFSPFSFFFLHKYYVISTHWPYLKVIWWFSLMYKQ